MDNQTLEYYLGKTTPQKKDNDPVNSPSHYTYGKYEVIDVINDWKLAFNLGNAIKYIARAGKKDKHIQGKHLEDLKKARFYLDYEIKKIEEQMK